MRGGQGRGGEPRRRCEVAGRAQAGGANTSGVQMLTPPHSLHWPRRRPCLADVFAAALLADAALPPVLADDAASAIFAPAALPPVLAETTAAAILAPAVRCRP